MYKVIILIGIYNCCQSLFDPYLLHLLSVLLFCLHLGTLCYKYMMAQTIIKNSSCIKCIYLCILLLIK